MFTENLPGFIFIIGCIVGLVAAAAISEARKVRREVAEADAELDARLATVTQINSGRARSMANHPAGKGLVR